MQCAVRKAYRSQAVIRHSSRYKIQYKSALTFHFRISVFSPFPFDRKTQMHSQKILRGAHEFRWGSSSPLDRAPTKNSFFWRPLISSGVLQYLPAPSVLWLSQPLGLLFASSTKRVASSITFGNNLWRPFPLVSSSIGHIFGILSSLGLPFCFRRPRSSPRGGTQNDSLHGLLAG